MSHDAASASPLGRSQPHESAWRHVSGEARYIDDLPEPPGTLHGAVVSSKVARGALISVDGAAALALPGVRWVLSAKDVPGVNNVGPVFHDEPLFAEGEVKCHGHHVAVVFADSLAQARAGAQAVRVEVTPLPALLSIEAAMAAGSFIGVPHVMVRGDVDGALASAPVKLSGVTVNGGQDHFYLETHAALAVPGDDDSLTIYTSTQHPTEVQTLVAEILGWSRNQVTVICPRMGGGFGGKETQAAWFAGQAALGAVRSGRACKVWLDRDTDMATTGRRHPFRTEWEAGFDEQGQLLALRALCVADGGHAADLSLSINDRALFHMANAYFIPALRLEGRVVRTNLVSNTAFRGFGGPQGMLVIEHILEQVADKLGLDPIAVREANFYRPGGDHTPYGQRVEGGSDPSEQSPFRLRRLVPRLVASSQWAERQAEIARFNSANRWKKRGLAFNPVQFGISFTASWLNQAGAHVLVYADGSVQLNHGGTEMGQGLYTKMVQVAAHELGVDEPRVRAMATRTDQIPNTSATAASSGTDLNGMAVREACRTLAGRLRAVAAAMLGVADAEMGCAAGSHAPRPLVDGRAAWAWSEARSLTFAEVARQAWFTQTSLAATGFYKTPEIHYDRSRGSGKPFHYFAYGAAVCEVELNGFTGEWRLLRADLLHDVGDSLAPDLDVGQIEGAFVQGVGWLTVEELVHGKEGELLTHSPDTYKIPAIGDVPVDLRVELLDEATQRDTIHGSKAVGEPPFMLGIAAHLALGRAVAAFGGGGFVSLPAPATVEVLLRAVEAQRGR